MFEDKNARYCGIQAYFPVNDSDDEKKVVLTLDEFRAISPFELGCSVYKRKNNAEMPEEMKAMFKSVCDDVMSLMS